MKNIPRLLCFLFFSVFTFQQMYSQITKSHELKAMKDIVDNTIKNISNFSNPLITSLYNEITIIDFSSICEVETNTLDEEWLFAIKNKVENLPQSVNTNTEDKLARIFSAPTFTSTPVTSVDEGDPYNYSITTNDADGDPVTVTAPTLPTWLSLSLVGDVTTFVGSGTPGSTDGTGTVASFMSPNAIAIDASGTIYVADTNNHVIRKVTPAGVVTIFAGSVGVPGSAEGTGIAASFNTPRGIAIDASGTIYVSDSNNHKIRKITPAGVVSTFVGSGSPNNTNGTGIAASFNTPRGIAFDTADNLYVADRTNRMVRKVTSAGVVTTLAGSGSPGSTDDTGTNASFDSPSDVGIDASGNVYVADTFNHTIRKITPGGVVTTFAGTTGVSGSTNGTGVAASFNSPFSLAVDSGGSVYVSDTFNHIIRRITSVGEVTTFSGDNGVAGSTDGTGTNASFNFPVGIVFDATGNNFYVAGSGSHKIRNIASSYELVGDSTGQAGVHNVVLEVNDGNGGITQQAFTITVNDLTPPSGYSVVIDQDPINNGNQTAVSFTFAGAEVGTTYNYTFTSSAGGTPVIGTGTIVTATDQITGIDLSGLADGTITLNVALTDASSNTGIDVTDTATKETGAPSGYSVVIDQDPINATNVSSVSFTLAGAEVGTTYNYIFTSSGGGIPVTGSGIIVTATDQITGIGLSGLANGTITLSVTLTDTSGNIGIAATDTSTKVNTAPTFTSTPITSINEGDIYTYAITTNDVDGDEVTVTAPTTPSWLSITSTASVSTLAGSGSSGSANGTGTAASFNDPRHIAVDTSGNLYVVDRNNHNIRKITPAGVVTTFAGSGSQGSSDGTGTAASFRFPYGIAADASGNVYVADTNNLAIRKITPAGVVTTLAGSAGVIGSTDGTGTAARFNFPFGIAVDTSGNLYVADRSNHTIRKITPTGEVTTLAGLAGNMGSIDDTGAAARFNLPSGVTVDTAGNVYVADTFNHNIRKITPAGAVTTLAGTGSVGSANGTGTAASFGFPDDVSVDALGNVYVADVNSHRIRRITPTGVVTTFAGSGLQGDTNGPAATASFNFPRGVTVDASGTIYVVDSTGLIIRKISTVFTLTGNSTGQGGMHNVVLEANDGNGGITQQAFTITVNDSTAPMGYSVVIDQDPINAGNDDSVSFTFASAEVGATYNYTFSTSGGAGTVTNSGIVSSAGETISNIDLSGLADGTITLSVTLTDTSGNTGSPATDTTTKVNTAPTFTSTPVTSVDEGDTYTYGITTNDADGDGVIVTTTTLPSWLTLTSIANVTTFAGMVGLSGGNTNGNGTDASFNRPGGVTVDALGNLYIADTFNHSIRKITPNGDVTIVAGTGSAGSANANGTDASFNFPSGIAVDTSGNLYVVDSNNHLIRRITPNGDVTTFAGTGSTGNTNGNGTDASFNFPHKITIDTSGNLYVTDLSHHLIRRIAPNGDVTTFAGTGSDGNTNGNGTNASFNSPRGITIDTLGNLYVVDKDNHSIRKIAPNGDVTTFAGTGSAGSTNGNGTNASFEEPVDIATDASGNLYVADADNQLIRKIAPNGDVTTFAGSGSQSQTNIEGDALTVSISAPRGIAVDALGNVYVLSIFNIISKITTTSHQLTGDSTGQVGMHNVVLEANDGNGGITQQAFTITVNDSTAPNGYSVVIDQDPINATNASTVSFTFASAEVGTNYNYTFTSSAGGTPVTGTGTILTATDQITGIDLSGLSDGTITLSATLTDTGGNTGVAATDTATKDTEAPGDGGTPYSVVINQDPINNDNQTGVSFTFAGAEVGATYNYTFSSSGGAGTVTGTGIVSSAGEIISGIDLSGLADGTITLSVTLTDTSGNTGSPATDTATKETVVPTGYSVVIDQDPINATNVSSVSFTFSDAEIGTMYNYTFSSFNGAIVTGTGTIVTATDQIIGIDLSCLANGTITLSVTLTDAAGNTGSAATDTSTKVNTAPTFTSTPVTSIDEGDPYTYDITMNDADGNSVLITTPTLPSWLSVTTNKVVSTLVGSGTAGNTNGTGTSASFNLPFGAAVDTFGNVYVADGLNHSIRKVTPSGVVTTLAGSGSSGATDGTGTAASFRGPIDLTVDASGNVYIADTFNHLIRKITPAGVVTTIAGSGIAGSLDDTGTMASFNRPYGIVVDAVGNLYVADRENHKIRRITSTGVVTTFAGSGSAGNVDGTGASASFNIVSGIAIDTSGTLYVADAFNHLIRKVTPAGVVTTLAGSGSVGSTDGTGTVASFNFPSALDIDVSGNIYVADTDNHLIRKITPAGEVTTIAGTGSPGNTEGIGTAASFNLPFGLSIDTSGTLYIADRNNQTIRKISTTYHLSGDSTGQAGDHPVVLEVDDGNGGVTQQIFTITVNDITIPTGYSVTIDQDPINSTNASTVSFTFASAEVGTTYNYTFTSSAGGTPVTGTGIILTATDQITGIDLSGLSDGTITLSATLTDTGGNTGVAATDTATKETVAPSGYSVTIDQDPINNANQTMVSFTFADAEVGTTYNYTMTSDGGGTPVTGTGTIVTATDQITMIDVSGLGDGTVTLSATLTDTAGNTGTPATDTSIKDTEAPGGGGTPYTVVIDQDPINNSNQTMVSFTFADAEVGTTYNYTMTSDGGGTPVTGTGTISTTTDQITMIDVSGLGDGTVTLSATLTDTSGNTGTPATDTSLKDTEAPGGGGTSYSVMIDQDPINNAIQTMVSFTFADAEVGTTYNYTMTSDGGGTPVTGTGTIVTPTDQITMIDVSGLGDGTVTLSATLTDTAGNTGTPATDTSLKDTEAPGGGGTSYTVVIDQDPINNANQTMVSFTFADAEVGTTYNYTMTSDGGGTPVTGTGTIVTPTDQITMIDVSGLGDGTITLSATLTDTAGNTGTPATDTSLKDTEAPGGGGTPYTVVIDQDPINNANQTMVSFTFADAEVGTIYNYTMTSDGGGTPVTGTGTISTTTDQITMIDVSGLGDGTVTLSATLTDTAGNTGTPATDTSLKDTEAPGGGTPYTVVIDQDPINNSNQTMVSFTFADAEVGTTYNYTMTSDGGGTPVTGTGTISTTSDQITMIDVSGLGDGTVTLSATLTDTAGNTGGVATDTALKDAIEPFIPIITHISDYTCTGDVNTTGDNTLKISGVSEEGSIIEVYQDGVSIGTTITLNSGFFTFDHTGTTLADGTYSFTVTTTDATGNLSAVSNPLTITINSVDTDGDGDADFCDDDDDGNGVDDVDEDCDGDGIVDSQDTDNSSCSSDIGRKTNYGISPNDDGINDVWFIENITAFPNNTVQVFNRSGKLVYKKKRYLNDWNGVSNQISNNGSNKPLPVGPYLFIIDLGDGSQTAKGWLYINY